MYKPPKVEPVKYWEQCYSVIDLETTIRNRGEDAIGKQQAAPYHPDNRVHLYGSTTPSQMNNLLKDPFRSEVRHIRRSFNSHFEQDLLTTDILVGQNIKFDILYLMTHHKAEFARFLRMGGVIWDTMQAEYLLTDQQSQFAPLGNKYRKANYDGSPVTPENRHLLRQGLAEKYGGVDKDDRIAEYWNNGIDTPDIPEVELADYLDGDLKNTSIVFREQFRNTVDRGSEFMNLVQTQMQAIVATTMCEFNGMKFDMDAAADEAVILASEHDQREVRMQNWMADELNNHAEVDEPDVLGADCNPGSPQQLSTTLLGGTFKHTKRLQMHDDEDNPLFIKTGPNKGDPKMKNFVIEVEVPPIYSVLGSVIDVADLQSNTLGYVLDNVVIEGMIPQVGGTTVIGVFLKNVLKYRELSKDINTYYIGLMNLTWPTDGCIHGSLNHCTTGTGRLSSTAPNIQNVSG